MMYIHALMESQLVANNAPTPCFNYDVDTIHIYRKFVHNCTCYNTRTATDILVHRKCRLFGAGKIRTMVDEFMKDRKTIEVGAKEVAKAEPTEYPADDYTRALIILSIVKRLPSYARVGGGMIICALSKYLTLEQWKCELIYIENSQDHNILWMESFIHASIVLREDSDSAQINSFIEAEAEKMPLQLSCMNHREYVELTFID